MKQYINNIKNLIQENINWKNWFFMDWKDYFKTSIDTLVDKWLIPRYDFKEFQWNNFKYEKDWKTISWKEVSLVNQWSLSQRGDKDKRSQYLLLKYSTPKTNEALEHSFIISKDKFNSLSWKVTSIVFPSLKKMWITFVALVFIMDWFDKIVDNKYTLFMFLPIVLYFAIWWFGNYAHKYMDNNGKWIRRIIFSLFIIWLILFNSYITYYTERDLYMTSVMLPIFIVLSYIMYKYRETIINKSIYLDFIIFTLTCNLWFILFIELLWDAIIKDTLYSIVISSVMTLIYSLYYLNKHWQDNVISTGSKYLDKKYDIIDKWWPMSKEDKKKFLTKEFMMKYDELQSIWVVENHVLFDSNNIYFVIKLDETIKYNCLDVTYSWFEDNKKDLINSMNDILKFVA